MNKLIITAWIFLLMPVVLISQNIPVSKDSAIQIALSYGLPVGLSEFDAELQGDSAWMVKSLMCDDHNGQFFRTMLIDAATGKMMNAVQNGIIFASFDEIESTRLNTKSINYESLPVVATGYKKLTFLYENESNPVFSDNEKMIAFQYDFLKIGIISVNGDRFQQICNKCSYPQWLNNNWLVYFKDGEHIYKKNIRTGEEIRITEKPYGYGEFKLSPDKKWIVYGSTEMWPSKDIFDNPVIYLSINGQGQNLCLISTDGKIKKYFARDWEYYSQPTWSANSDTIYFYIDDTKYIATDFSTDTIQFQKCNSLQNLSLWDYEKIRRGSFPLNNSCQILEVDAGTLTPVRFLVKEPARYRDINFSSNKKYLVFGKKDNKQNIYSLWIKRLK